MYGIESRGQYILELDTNDNVCVSNGIFFVFVGGLEAQLSALDIGVDFLCELEESLLAAVKVEHLVCNACDVVVFVNQTLLYNFE